MTSNEDGGCGGVEVPAVLAGAGVAERRTLYGGPDGQPTFFEYASTFNCSVPFVDRDGAMPSSAEQVKWIEDAAGMVPGVRRVWGSTWECDGASTLLALERRLATRASDYSRTVTTKDAGRLPGLVRPMAPKPRFSAFITLHPLPPDEGHWTQLHVESLRDPDGDGRIGVTGTLLRPGGSAPSAWFEEQARVRGWTHGPQRSQVALSQGQLEAFLSSLSDLSDLRLHECTVSTMA